MKVLVRVGPPSAADQGFFGDEADNSPLASWQPSGTLYLFLNGFPCKVTNRKKKGALITISLYLFFWVPL